MDILFEYGFGEGQQVVLLEAMASGCYCLARSWDGAEEVLPADYLYVTDRELREKIKSYCDAPDASKHRHQDFMRTIAEEKFNFERSKTLLCHTFEGVTASILA